jgi:hypothetical protein
VTASPAPGHHRLLGPDGAELETVDANFAVDEGALVVWPKQQPVLRVDFADVDAFSRGDYLFTLTLAGGERVEASMLGKRFTELADATAEALTAYQAKNLLLQEPLGGESFDCDVARDGEERPARLRVWATSLAVLPRGAVPYAIPFGELAGLAFEEDRYAIDLSTASGKVLLLRLGKQLQPCFRLIEQRLTDLRKRTAEALAYLAPQLPSLTARRLVQAMPDGVPARQALLDAIDPTIWPALVSSAIVEPKLRSSAEALAARCPAGEAAIGLKETNARQDADDSEEQAEEMRAEGQGGDEPAAPETGSPPPAEPPAAMAGRVVWFAFPIYSEKRDQPGNAVAVEAVTRAGRATYFFRIAPPQTYREASPGELQELARQRVRSVSRALVALSFKREPIWLPDDKIRSGPYARYRLALRLSAPLKASRANFVGRAVHGPAWQKQVDAALRRALL